MKALSIRQPWAWLILHGGKDIENRSWSTKFRGPVLIHAAQGLARNEYDVAINTVIRCQMAPLGFRIPAFDQLQRGGIIGSVEITDCVQYSDSPWFFGDYGFVLATPKAIPFIPLRGKLGFFEVDESLLKSHG